MVLRRFSDRLTLCVCVCIYIYNCKEDRNRLVKKTIACSKAKSIQEPVLSLPLLNPVVAEPGSIQGRCCRHVVHVPAAGTFS